MSANLQADFEGAKHFAASLSDGTHSFTSRTAERDIVGKDDSRDWHLALGGHSYFGKGSVTIATRGSRRHYCMVFEWHVRDRYNWDHGKTAEVPLLGVGVKVADSQMAVFHLAGIAREFSMFGVQEIADAWSE